MHILLHINHRHVSATHMAIFRLMTKRIQLQHCINFNCVSVFITLKKATLLAETCRWLLLAFIAVCLIRHVIIALNWERIKFIIISYVLICIQKF
jgi:hypothetical protein